MARAAAAAGTLMCLSTIATSTPAEVAAAAPGAPRWFQLYVFRDRGVTRALVEQAAEHGYGAIVLTVDCAAPRTARARPAHRLPGARGRSRCRASPRCAAERLGGRDAARALGAIDPSLTWADLDELRSFSPLPLVVKGIQTAEDAELACEHGVDAIVVSNHGGRQLDGVAPTAELLPEIVEAVAGRIEVLRRRRHPARHRRRQGARARRAGRARRPARRSGGSPATAKRGRRTCSSCCATRPSSRSRSAAARRRTASRRAHLGRIGGP